MRGKSSLKFVMEENLSLSHRGWMILTQRLTLFFVVLAGANELVWRMFSTDTWVTFKTFVLPFAVMLFFIAQTPLLKSHWTGEVPDEN